MKLAYCVHLVVQVQKRFHSVDKFGRLFPGSDLVKFPVDRLVVGFVLDLDQNVPLSF